MLELAILGGGIAGLTTAYQLSRTAALRAQFDVTVYQMGVREARRRRWPDRHR